MGTKERAQREAGSWVERAARLGYLVKGVVYVTVGLLALQAALGVGGRTTGASGALQSLARQPFGAALIGVVAVGLVGYALWRAVQALVDVERKGRSPKGLLKRAGYLLSGLAYGALALEAWRLLLGFGSGSSGESAELWTARLLTAPLGGWLVGAGALALFGLAVNAAVVAAGRMYRSKLELDRMGVGARAVADATAVAGLLGRGAVFAAVGVLLLRAALTSNPQEAGDSAEALGAIAGVPYGPWLLGLVALGLVAFGAYAGVQARYRKMDV